MYNIDVLAERIDKLDNKYDKILSTLNNLLKIVKKNTEYQDKQIARLDDALEELKKNCKKKEFGSNSNDFK